MTIRFAGARAGDKSPIHAWRCRSVSLCAANDNVHAPFQDTSLIAALRHFGEYGLAAKNKARDNALNAPVDERAQWLAIYRHFDPRLAEHLATETSGQRQ